jgi:hypothetical protein
MCSMSPFLLFLQMLSCISLSPLSKFSQLYHCLFCHSTVYLYRLLISTVSLSVYYFLRSPPCLVCLSGYWSPPFPPVCPYLNFLLVPSVSLSRLPFVSSFSLSPCVFSVSLHPCTSTDLRHLCPRCPPPPVPLFLLFLDYFSWGGSDPLDRL